MVLAFVVALALVGCGSTSNDGLSGAAGRQLQMLVGQVRRAAAAHDRAGAERSLASLQRAAASYEKSGAIGKDRAARILADATRVQARLALLTTTSTIPVTVPTTSTEPPGPGQGKGHGNGHDKGDKHKAPKNNGD